MPPIAAGPALDMATGTTDAATVPGVADATDVDEEDEEEEDDDKAVAEDAANDEDDDDDGAGFDEDDEDDDDDEDDEEDDEPDDAAAAAFDAAAAPATAPIPPLPTPTPALDDDMFRGFLPFELVVELLLSSAPDEAIMPFCMSALTISCLASDVFVPGLVRLIFILSD